MYPEVCYYPVTEGSRPVECVPLVEVGPKTDFYPGANSKMSTAVWLNPTNLTVSVIPRAKFATLLDLQQVGGIFQNLTSIGRRCTEVRHNPTLFSCIRCLRRGARMRVWPPHYPKVVRGDEAHRIPNLRCWHAQEQVLGWDLLTSGSQDGRLRLATTLRVTVSRNCLADHHRRRIFINDTSTS